MKLNPPGSSSDLEVARAIARRLYHRARGTEPVPEPPSTAAAPPVSATPPPPAIVSAPEPQPPPPEPPVPPAVLGPEPTDSQLEPQPPELDAPELKPPELEAPELKPEPALEPEPPAQPSEPVFQPDELGLADEPAAAYGADTGEVHVQENAFEQLPPGGDGPATGAFEVE